MSKQLGTRPLTDHVNLELLHLGMLQLGLANNPLLPKFIASSELTLAESFAPLCKTLQHEICTQLDEQVEIES